MNKSIRLKELVQRCQNTHIYMYDFVTPHSTPQLKVFFQQTKSYIQHVSLSSVSCTFLSSIRATG